MNEITIGSPWRSRRDASNMRIIRHISQVRVFGHHAYFIEYYSSVQGCSMTTVTGLGEWLSHFELMDA